MAKYEDYVKDELENEIEDAAEQTEDRREEAAEIPERFKGKSSEEIAKAYTELERLNSRQAQDLGALRKSVDQLLELKSPSPAPEAQATSKKPLSVDDLYEDPDESIRKVVREESEDRIAQLERELQEQRLQRHLQDFESKFPGFQQRVQDPEFINWIREKPYRVALAQRAEQGDFGAAEELFGPYYDTHVAAEEAGKKESKRRKVQAAGLEDSGAGVPETTSRYSRSKLMDKRIAAKRGDYEAERWLAERGADIAAAYAEGRIDD